MRTDKGPTERGLGEVYSTRGLADRFGHTPRWWASLVKRGLLPAFRGPSERGCGHFMVKREDVERLLAAHVVQPKAKPEAPAKPTRRVLTVREALAGAR